MSITVSADVLTGKSAPVETHADLAAILPPAVAERAWFEHLYDRTAASALRALAALPDTRWHDRVSQIHIDFETLITQDWRDPQSRLLIRIAASLYGSPYANASAADLTDLEEPGYFTAAMDAVRIARDGLKSYEPLDLPYPRFIVQHTGRDMHQVVPVDPAFNERPVEGGADLGSFEQAAALRDRLNLEAAAQ